MAFKYHVQGSKAFTNTDEPLFLTKWIATFVLPPILAAKYGSAVILSEQIIEIGGLQTEKLPALVEQGFRGDKRFFPGSVPDGGNAISLPMKFECNVDKSGKIYPYNTFRDWSRLQHDNQTGIQLLKRDVVGQLTLEIHDKVGTVLEKFFSPSIFMESSPNEKALNYMSEGIYQLDITMKAENWSSRIIGD